jgi:gliding motility-associated-like protein
MTLNNGFGDVSIKNKNFNEEMAGKITAVNHCNSVFSWIITRKINTRDFYSYLVTDTGVLCYDPVISTAGDKILADIGMMKASPAGDILALPVNTSNIYIELFDFDNSTGVVSNPKRIYKTEDVVYAYGVEFSGDGKFLYITTGGKSYELIQYDLTLKTEQGINESAVVISKGNMYSMQIAPDSKIYVARVNDNYLSVIEHPGIKGPECLFREKEIYLGDNTCLMGLPNFNQSYFYFPSFSFKNACVGDTTSVWIENNSNIDSVEWVVNSANIDTVAQNPPFSIENVFLATGNYGVDVKLFHCGAVDTLSGILSIHRAPDVSLGSDTTISEGSTLTLEAANGMDSYFWNTGDESPSIIIWDTGVYWVEVSKDGCSASDTVTVYNIPANVQFPTAFSPNSDGINDIFLPRVTGVVSGYQIEIYNRFGEQVWRNSDLNKGWNGEYNGKKCPSENYVWYVKYNIVKGETPKTVEKAGSVVLIR